MNGGDLKIFSVIQSNKTFGAAYRKKSEKVKNIIILAYEFTRIELKLL